MVEFASISCIVGGVRVSCDRDDWHILRFVSGKQAVNIDSDYSLESIGIECPIVLENEIRNLAQKMSDNQKLMACDIEIHGKIPKEALQMFAAAQAMLLGLRGYIEQVSEGLYKGQLQGEAEVIETFKNILATASEFVAALKELVIQNLRAIDKYTFDSFVVK